ncbi:hypothetical protein [Streptomyces sp. NPDC002133]|uniref:hypothetical protein n=1 Tax=Streptomyces sp. NPDC002133 TaxID=3154409 RepID=UPI003332ABF4
MIDSSTVLVIIGSAVVSVGGRKVNFSPRVRFWANIGGCVFWVAASYLLVTEDPVFGGAWLWLAWIGAVFGFLGALRGVYVARQERSSSE